ncbi:MAG: CoA pyrophosphatase [Bacteroidales bacterium]|nr:CoA pyrophosphatase [Bacteroidales bacterium]
MEIIPNISFNSFVDLLKKQIKLPLPGEDAQYIMAPKTHLMDQRLSIDHDSVKKAAVLILLYSSANEIKTVLIKRTAYNGVHSKQISFPGGKSEVSDKSLYHTACRETYEEIGIKTSDVKLIGKISDLYIPPSNFLVSPYIAHTNTYPLFRTDPTEVESILEVKLSHLLKDSVISEKEVYTAEKNNIKAPCFYINNAVIWGATAMMISELKIIINEIQNADSILLS